MPITPSAGQQTSEHRLSLIAIILIAAGVGLTAIATAPISLPAAVLGGLGALGVGATAAGYAISRGIAKTSNTTETPPAK